MNLQQKKCPICGCKDNAGTILKYGKCMSCNEDELILHPISKRTYEFYQGMEGFRIKIVQVMGVPIHIMGVPGLNSNRVYPVYIEQKFKSKQQRIREIMATKITKARIIVKSVESEEYRQAMHDAVDYLSQPGGGLGGLRDTIKDVEDLRNETKNRKANQQDPEDQPTARHQDESSEAGHESLPPLAKSQDPPMPQNEDYIDANKH